MASPGVRASERKPSRNPPQRGLCLFQLQVSCCRAGVTGRGYGHWPRAQPSANLNAHRLWDCPTAGSKAHGPRTWHSAALWNAQWPWTGITCCSITLRSRACSGHCPGREAGHVSPGARWVFLPKVWGYSQEDYCSDSFALSWRVFNVKILHLPKCFYEWLRLVKCFLTIKSLLLIYYCKNKPRNPSILFRKQLHTNTPSCMMDEGRQSLWLHVHSLSL